MKYKSNPPSDNFFNMIGAKPARSYSDVPVAKNYSSEGSNFSNVEFIDGYLESCDFSNSKFLKCIFKSVKIDLSIFDEAIMEGCSFIDCEFYSLILMDMKFIESHFSNVVFLGCSLDGCQFERCEMEKISLRPDNLGSDNNFNRASFVNTKFGEGTSEISRYA